MPFTFTWTRPVILLPSAPLQTWAMTNRSRYALAHEWSHVERRDAWAWNLTALAGAVLFYQPLFWWLRRQLRLCQDYLADDRAAAIGSPEDYAACLVRLAREHRRPPSRPPVPAMGIYDQPLEPDPESHHARQRPRTDRAPLPQGPGASARLAATALAILIVAGLRADSTPAEDPKPQAPKAAPRAAKAEPKGETLHYTGKVKDKDTGKPIAGAIVTVRRKDSDNREGNRIIEESRHTTDAEGVTRSRSRPSRSP